MVEIDWNELQENCERCIYPTMHDLMVAAAREADRQLWYIMEKYAQEQTPKPKLTLIKGGKNG